MGTVKERRLTIWILRIAVSLSQWHYQRANKAELHQQVHQDLDSLPISATSLINRLARVSLHLFVFQSPPDANPSSFPRWARLSMFYFFSFASVSLFTFPVTFSPSMHVSCLLAALLSCLLVPSPVTLGGFNHQLNVTPYLRNA